jgi:hypothetical protein
VRSSGVSWLPLLLEGVTGVKISPRLDRDFATGEAFGADPDPDPVPSSARSTAEAMNAGAALRVIVFCLLGPALCGPGETGTLGIEEVDTESVLSVLTGTGVGSGTTGSNVPVLCWARLWSERWEVTVRGFPFGSVALALYFGIGGGVGLPVGDGVTALSSLLLGSCPEPATPPRALS